MRHQDYSENETEAAALSAIITDHLEVQELEIESGITAFVKRDGNISLLEELRTAPLRHRGVEKVADVPSFLKMVGRHTSLGQVVRLSMRELLIESIFNYGTDSAPEWKDHKVQYKLEHDKRLAKWLAIQGGELSQVAFMEFLEDRLEDIVQHQDTDPSQSELQSVISDLSVTTDSKFTSNKNLSNGNYVFSCSSDTKASVEVPKEFHLGLPVFEGSRDRLVIPIRLRYRVKEGKLTFIILFHNWLAILEAAWKAVVDDITKELPEGVEYISVA